MTAKPLRGDLTKDEESVLRFLYDNQKRKPCADEIARNLKISGATVRGALAHLQEIGFCDGPPSLLLKAQNCLKEIGPNFGPTSSGYAEAIILLASVIESADEQALSQELGFDEDFVRTVGSRLRNCGIWVEDAVAKHVEDSWKKDAIAFFLDVNVAEGHMTTSVDKKSGERMYAITDSGLKSVKKLIGRSPKP